MTPKQFRAKAIVHYRSKLHLEKTRFGVKALSDCFCEHNSRVVVEHLEDMWKDLGKQLGCVFHVDYAHGDPQNVFVVLSESKVPRPNEMHALYVLMEQLTTKTDQKAKERLGDDMESLDLYEGPYKMDVPEAVMEQMFVD